jgi:hypothetical protein
MSASTIILVILLILLSVLIGMIKFTKLGQKYFCPAANTESPSPEKKE